MSGAAGHDLAGYFGSPARRPSGRERSPRGWAAAHSIPIGTPAGMTQEQQNVTESAVTQLAAGVMSVEERIGRLEAEAGRVAPTLSDLETRVQGIGGTAQSITDTMAKFEEAMVNMLTQITGTKSSLDAFKNQMTNSLATAESTLTASLNGLAQRVSQNEVMIRQVETMTSNMPEARQGSASQPGSTNFVPWKHLTPSKFGNKVELWREWQEDVRGYFDGTRPGIREALQSLEHEDEEQGSSFIRQEHAGFAADGTCSMASFETPH